MNKGTLFFFCACFITLLSVINLSLGPIISGKVGKDWGKLNCAKLVDDYDIKKSEAMKKCWNTPEMRLKRSLIMKEYWKRKKENGSDEKSDKTNI